MRWSTSVASIGSMNEGMADSTAPDRSISACATAGAWLTQIASRLGLDVVVGATALHRLRELLGIPALDRGVGVALVDEQPLIALVLRRSAAGSSQFACGRSARA